MPFDQTQGSAPPVTRFNLETFFDGVTTGTGFYQGRSGEIGRQMNCRIEGIWEDSAQTLTLNEEFWFVDGRYETRVWTIRKAAENDYRFTAGDIVSEGQGRHTETNVFRSTYRLHYALPNPVLGRDHMTFSFEDYMLGVSEDRMLNRSRMKKFGYWLGDILLWIKRAD